MENNTVYCYDFVDTVNKICIEFNGDYWHCNPKIYESSWVHPHIKLSAGEIQNRDNEKIKAIEKRGYKCLVVWEREYNISFDNLIKKCLTFIETSK